MLLTFAAFPLLVCWLVAVPSFMFIGIRKLVGLGAQQARSALNVRRLGFLDLGFALVLGTAPLVAAKLAEASTGWVDPDGDGMLGDFVAGRYDWGDYVLPSAVIWGIGFVVALVIARLLLYRRWE